MQGRRLHGSPLTEKQACLWHYPGFMRLLRETEFLLKMTSSAWFTLVLMWPVAGFAFVAFMDAAMKSEGDNGIFFHWQSGEDAVVGICMSLTVFLFWPLFVVLSAVLALRPDLDPAFKAPLVKAPRGVPRRRIHLPRLDTPFWQPPEHEAEVVSRMIRLRLKKDRRLADEPPPWRWPMERLWATTESLMMELVRGYLALREDGLAPADIVARLEAARPVGAAHPPDARLRPYLKWRLAQADPDYLALGHRVFAPALRLAILWARAQIRREGNLPNEWLGVAITLDEVEPSFEGLFFPAGPHPNNWRDALAGKRREWALIKLRLKEGDTLMQYCEPAGDDGEFNGQHGIALVRNDRAVAWIAAVAAEVEAEEIEWVG